MFGQQLTGFQLIHLHRKAACKFLLIATFFFAVRGYGQSFYYITYHTSAAGKPAISYLTLLRVLPDGSAIAKTRYKDVVSGREFSPLELNYLDANEPSTKQKYLVLSDSLVISGDDSANFSIPRFVFEPMNSGKQLYYEPVAVECRENNAAWNRADSVSITQLNYDELTPEFVGQFYFPDDDFYKDLFSPGTRGPSDIDKTTTFHLVIVANTLDSVIGQTTKVDSATIAGFFSAFVGKLGLKLNTYIISGRNLSKHAVLSTLNKLKPSHSDVVVFYYSGHGFRYSNDSSIYPRMSLRISHKQNIDQNNLAVEGVYKRIVKMGARVNIVLSDCCNNDIGNAPLIGKDILTTKPKDGLQLNYGNCVTLFFPKQPFSILCTAAQKNQLASGTVALGGFFTNFFKAELVKSVYGKDAATSWLSIFAAASKSTSWQALSAPCDGNTPASACCCKSPSVAQGRSVQLADSNLIH